MTDAETVIAVMSGWPQCWKCGVPQKPHNARLKAMRRNNMEMCCCTPCRSEQIACAHCWARYATFSMRWLHTSKYNGLDLMEWKPFCLQCCRSKRLDAGVHWNVPQRESTDFRSYPDGPSVIVPGKRRQRYNRTRMR